MAFLGQLKAGRGAVAPAARLLALALLLLAAAGCTPSVEEAGLRPQSCTPRVSFAEEDAGAREAGEARVFRATYRHRDCSQRYGLAYEGEIAGPAVKRLIASYGAWSRDREIDFLVMNSPGGSVQAGLVMAHFVISQDLAVLIGDHMVCVSMCSFVFIAANRRLMDEGARLGIHSASDAAGTPSPRTNYTLARLLSLVPGARADAYLEIANQTPPNSVTWLNAEQARALGFAD